RDGYGKGVAPGRVGDSDRPDVPDGGEQKNQLHQRIRDWHWRVEACGGVGQHDSKAEHGRNSLHLCSRDWPLRAGAQSQWISVFRGAAVCCAVSELSWPALGAGPMGERLANL